MNESFYDAPRFPTERAVDLEHQHDHVRGEPETPDSFAEWLRHGWPAIFLVGGLGLAAIAAFVWLSLVTHPLLAGLMLFGPVAFGLRLGDLGRSWWRSN